MSALFTNPFAMFLGGLLIASPIIIHLINRVRFKRVRWAAMEFLLKAQKRTRRKMIIEQLLLLFLRCLLMVLAGLLMGRFLGCDAKNTTSGGLPTYHVVLIDDTLSMSDLQRGDDGQIKEAITEIKTFLPDKLVKKLALAPTPQELEILRLSELSASRPFGRVGTTTYDDVTAYLANVKATPRHDTLLQGLDAAEAIFNDKSQYRKVLHIVGDFRSADWGGTQQEVLRERFKKLQGEKTSDGAKNIEVHLIDLVYPARAGSTGKPVANDNLSIIGVRPASRVVPKDRPIEIQVEVRNFSKADRTNVNVHMYVNGVERLDGLVNVPKIPANDTVVVRVYLALDQTAPDKPETEEEQLKKFSVITARLDGEPNGLNGDNFRYAVVEVQKKVPVLIIDGSPGDRNRPDAESYFIRTTFRTSDLSGYDIQVKGPNELDTLNLKPYSAIYLCDVAKLTPAAVRNLEDYTANGGGVAFFMGPSIKSNDIVDTYDKLLFREGKGIFPVQIDKDRPYSGIALDKPEEERKEIKRNRAFEFNEKLLIPRSMRTHPALGGLYRDLRGNAVNEQEYDRYLRFVVLDRWFTYKPFRSEEATAIQPDILMYTENLRPKESYAPSVNAATNEILKVLENPKFEKYKSALARMAADLRNRVASNEPIYVLKDELDRLLEDEGDKSKGLPNMKEFWQFPEVVGLRQTLEKLRDDISRGDPIYVSKTFGKGRVVAWLSSAGSSWNDHSSFGRTYFPILVQELHNYLVGAGSEFDFFVGGTIPFNFDQKTYDSKIKQIFYAEDERGKSLPIVNQGEQIMTPDDKSGLYNHQIVEPKSPGVYFVRATERILPDPTKGGEIVLRTDWRAVAVNVDSANEGNLDRASTEDIEQIAAAKLHEASDDSYLDALVTKKRDWSEGAWIYLVIILVLVFEQFMAVRLSFHLAPAEGTGPAIGAAQGAAALG